LVDLHDLPKLEEGRRDAAIILELGREVGCLKRREPDQRGDKAVGSRLYALKGQHTTVMRDRRRVHHEVALVTVVEDQHHGPLDEGNMRKWTAEATERMAARMKGAGLE
jgi:hypothetical protein